MKVLMTLLLLVLSLSTFGRSQRCDIELDDFMEIGELYIGADALDYKEEFNLSFNHPFRKTILRTTHRSTVELDLIPIYAHSNSSVVREIIKRITVKKRDYRIQDRAFNILGRSRKFYKNCFGIADENFAKVSLVPGGGYRGTRYETYKLSGGFLGSPSLNVVLVSDLHKDIVTEFYIEKSKIVKHH